MSSNSILMSTFQCMQLSFANYCLFQLELHTHVTRVTNTCIYCKVKFSHILSHSTKSIQLYINMYTITLLVHPSHCQNCWKKHLVCAHYLYHYDYGENPSLPSYHKNSRLRVNSMFLLYQYLKHLVVFLPLL